jgi:hydrogenase/urease accessory protein HupE
MLHPVTAVGHALPLLALGLLGGQQGARPARWILLVLPLALLLGATLARLAPVLPWVPLVNKASFALLGVLVAGAWPGRFSSWLDWRRCSGSVTATTTAAR